MSPPRIGPSEQALAALHKQFAATALASVAGNAETAKQRLAFADQNITNARTLVARPAGQPDRVWSTRSAPPSRRSARPARCSTPSTAPAPTSTGRWPRCPSAIADIQNGINQAANSYWQQGNTPHAAELDRCSRRRGQGGGRRAEAPAAADPLGAFTRLTQADAELDRLLASVAEEREATERLSRAFDQALFTAQSRVRRVSDFIDTRRGSIGPEARTRLAEAVRQLQAAQAKRPNQY